MILTDKPLVTFALTAYNQDQFISQAIIGAFSQTYTPLQILLSDDCSSDRTFEIMQAMSVNYNGIHTILLNRNERNLGWGGHVNRVMELATGDLIVIAAGDDISIPERTSELIHEYLVDPKNAYSVSSKAQYIDADGNKLPRFTIFSDYEKKGDEAAYRVYHAVGCTHAWHKETFNFFGKLNDNICNEDVVIGLRSYLLGGTSYLNKVLVYYRTHGSNISNIDVNTKIKLTPIARNEKRLKSALEKQSYLVQQLQDVSTYEFKVATKRKTQIIKNRIINELFENSHYIKMVSSYPYIRFLDLRTGIKYKHTFRLFIIMALDYLRYDMKTPTKIMIL